jgi:hypothetical protein
MPRVPGFVLLWGKQTQVRLTPLPVGWTKFVKGLKRGSLVKSASASIGLLDGSLVKGGTFSLDDSKICRPGVSLMDVLLRSPSVSFKNILKRYAQTAQQSAGNRVLLITGRLHREQLTAVSQHRN